MHGLIDKMLSADDSDGAYTSSHRPMMMMAEWEMKQNDTARWRKRKCFDEGFNDVAKLQCW